MTIWKIITMNIGFIYFYNKYFIIRFIPTAIIKYHSSSEHAITRSSSGQCITILTQFEFRRLIIINPYAYGT